MNKMKKNAVKIILLVAISLLLVACSASTDDVPSLEATPAAVVEAQPLDDEAKVMAFVECVRDEGMQLKDPVVEADGNIQPPEVVEGVTYTREEWTAPYEICDHHIEGISLGEKSGDMSEQLDQMVTLATCLNEKGFKVDEPTIETIEQWLIEFRVIYDWADPDAMAAYKECSSMGE